MPFLRDAAFRPAFLSSSSGCTLVVELLRCQRHQSVRKTVKSLELDTTFHTQNPQRHTSFCKQDYCQESMGCYHDSRVFFGTVLKPASEEVLWAAGTVNPPSSLPSGALQTAFQHLPDFACNLGVASRALHCCSRSKSADTEGMQTGGLKSCTFIRMGRNNAKG